MKKTLIYLIAFLFAFNSYAQFGPVDNTLDEVKIEFETDDFYAPFYRGDNTYTPITTYKGNSYFVYVDKDYRPKIGKINRDGSIDGPYFIDNKAPFHTVQVDPRRNLPDGHQKFSIGVDKDGYIHVLGDMHNYGSAYNSTRPENSTYVDRYLNKHIMYWVSEEPEEIDSLIFEGNDENTNEKVGTIPGHGFTYASFYTDMDGQLYAGYRSRVSGVGHYDGEMGWFLARYDLENREWIALGGLAPSDSFPNNYETEHKAVFWEDNGIDTDDPDKNWYQGFYGDLVYFDFNDRMHAIAQINNNNLSKNYTDIVYAYSDDSGATFNKADGTAVNQLPVRVEAGPNQASIVAAEAEAETEYGYGNGPSICADKEGIPIVTYSNILSRDSNGNQSYSIGIYKYWDEKNNKWTQGRRYPSDGLIRHNTITDANGIITYVGTDGNGWVARESGLTTTAYSNRIVNVLGGYFFGLDRKAVREQNVIRGFLHDSNGDTLKIVKLIGNPELSPIANEWESNSLGNASSEESKMYNDIFQLKSTGTFNENFSGEYINQSIKGNFELEARVVNVDFVSNASFAGLMVRDENTSHFGVAVTAYEGVKTISKGAANDKMSIAKEYTPSEWLKIRRVGTLLESYRSDNGKDWTKLSSRKIEMNNTVTYGLVAGSGNTTDYGHSRIDHVSLKEIEGDVNSEHIVAHYKFNNDVTDSSANNLDGTNKKVSFRSDSNNFTGYFGGDATKSYVDVSSNELLKPNNITVSVWVKPNNLTGTKGILKSANSNGFNSGWRLITNGTRAIARITTSNGISKSLGAKGLKLNEWNHITFSYDGNTIALYVNGQKPELIAHPGDIEYVRSSIPMRIGNSNGTGYFSGEMDEIKIYDRALNQNYISENFEVEKEYYTKGLIAHYKFTDTTLDSALNDLDGVNKGITFNSNFNSFTGYFGGDATKSYVDVPSNELLKPNNITVSVWVKPNDLTGTNGILKSANSNGFNSGWRLITNGTRAIARITTSERSKALGAKGLKLNEWNHIVFSYDGKTIVLYVNDEEPESIAHPGAIEYLTASSAMRIGNSNGTKYFKGEIDDIKIYGTALTREKTSRMHTNSLALSSNNKDTSEIAITIYPNPSNKEININYPDFTEGAVLQIVDTNGRLIINQKIEETNSIIDVSNLESGMYFLKITNSIGKTEIKKLLVN